MSDRLDRIEKALVQLLVSQQETNKQIDKTQKQIGKLSNLVGNSKNNIGDMIEDFFFHSLENKTLNHIQYDSIYQNLTLKISKQEIGQIDIVLLNGTHIALIEIKTNAHMNDFKQLDKYVDNYKKVYPDEKRKIFIYYASFGFNKEIKETAIQRGYGLLSLKSNVISIGNNKLKEFN